MYRGTSELHHHFGVESGRYTGSARTISLRRAPADVRTRLATILEGTARPRPLAAKKTGHSWLWGFVPFVSIILLGWIGFGAKDRPLHGPMTLFLYVPLAVCTAYAILYRLRGTAGITDGTYLLPLDLVEIAGDRATVWPLGDLRKVTRSKLSLILTFRDGSTREIACESRAEVRTVAEDLERAHTQLVNLSHGSDEGAALDADPFHSLRVDESWSAAVAQAPTSSRARLVASLALGTIGAIGFVAVRNQLSQRNADNAINRWTLATAAAAAPRASAAPSFDATAIDLTHIAVTPDAELNADERARVDALISEGLVRYEQIAATSPEGPAFVRAALLRGRATGHRAISIGFHPTGKTELAWGSHHAGAFFEGRVENALRHAFGEQFSPAILRVERAKDGYPDIDVSYTINEASLAAPRETSEILREEFVFTMNLQHGDEVRLKGSGKPLKTFSLTLPKASTLPTLRVNTLFPQQKPSPDHLMAARAFDRLYDELYSVFYSGAIRVPLPRETIE